MHGIFCAPVCPAYEAVGVSVCVCLLLGSQSDGRVSARPGRVMSGRIQWGPGASLATTMEVPPDVTSHEL